MNENERLEIQQFLSETFPTAMVVYNATSNLKLKYPAILYEIDGHGSIHAGNKSYLKGTTVKVTIMSKIPGIDTRDLLDRPGTRHRTSFVSDGIQHDVYLLRTRHVV